MSALDAAAAGRVVDAVVRLGLLPDDAEERRLLVAFLLRDAGDGAGYRLDIEAADGVCLVLTSRKNRNDVTEYSLTRKGAGYAGFAGSTSEATHGNCQNASASGGNDNGGHFAGDSQETNPANPANPAVETWDA